MYEEDTGASSPQINDNVNVTVNVKVYEKFKTVLAMYSALERP